MDAIVLDWDGTLADSVGGLYRANAAVMARYGLPFDAVAYRRNFDHDWRRMYERLGIPPGEIEAAGRLWWDAFDGGASTELLPGAREALGRLS
ncbi:MAG TPA: hypothetical protein VIV06_04865, partial [Candidatus Limnocylindrales bacterium]